MQFLRKITKAVGENFKETADTLWEQMGDQMGAPKHIKDSGRTLGKYALTAQLAMTMNFPDHADMFRHSFNVTGNGPTGSKGFKGTLIGHMLDTVADYSQAINQEALGVQGFSDVAATSTLNTLTEMAPMITGMQLMKESKKTNKKRGKANGSTKLL